MTLLGERIGKIRIVDHLGKGGMGEVYVGYDEKLKRKVAVKAIRGDKRFDERTKSRFIREAELLSQLEHPNICRIYDYLETEDSDVLVLELIKGRDLNKKRETGLNHGEKLKISIQIAEVLADAHAHRVVHRDLKPENVMIDDRGDVKVLDFGLAHSVVEQTTATMTLADVSTAEFSTTPTVPVKMPGGGFRTEHGIVMGTPMYMSPEQARGEPATSASDMYSLGLLMQWLFTGTFPYPKNLSPEEVLTKAMKGETLPFTGMETELRKTLERLKAPEPSVRPTAIDTVDRLKWIKEAPRRKTKRRITLAVVTLIGFLLILGTTLSTIGFLRVKRAESETKEEAKTARETVVLLQEFLSSVDPGEKGKDLRVIELLEAFRPRLEKLNKPEIQASLYDTYSRTFVSLGDYDSAYDFAEKALAIRKQNMGEEHPDTLSSLSNLSDAMERQGRALEAEQLFRQCWETRTRILGEAHPNTLASLHDVANALLDQGKAVDAERLYRQCMKVQSMVLGDDHPHTLASLNNLTIALQDQGKYLEAEQLLRQSLEIERKRLPEEHPDILASVLNLAFALHNQGKLVQAEQLYRQCLEVQKRILGEEHPHTLIAVNNLAYVLDQQGKDEEAVQLYRQCLEIQKRTLGEAHPDTLLSINNLASSAYGRGQISEAERLFRQCLDARKKALGKEHPDTLISMQNLSLLLENHGTVSEAEILQRDCLEIQEKVLGDTHRDTLGSMVVLAQLLKKQGKIDEAIAWYRKAAKGGDLDAQTALKRLGEEW